ncbi:secretin receptor [Babesia caballi]|uniref:Secretin receptor n=1 Tax=Babesia caballi TaxID=5871 RepID=A0AAV4LT21_BABCB|nr:secretin receptor [Babesia caballi]
MARRLQNLHQTRDTQRHVRGTVASQVEGVQRHLGGRLPDGLAGHTTHGFSSLALRPLVVPEQRRPGRLLHVDPVLAVRELDDGAVRAAHGRVVAANDVLHRLENAALQVPGLGRLHTGVHQTLTTGHAVEEVLLRPQPRQKPVGDEPAGTRPQVAKGERGQRAQGRHHRHTPALQCLLRQQTANHAEVDLASLGPGEDHARKAVLRELEQRAVHDRARLVGRAGDVTLEEAVEHLVELGLVPLELLVDQAVERRARFAEVSQSVAPILCRQHRPAIAVVRLVPRGEMLEHEVVVGRRGLPLAASQTQAAQRLNRLAQDFAQLVPALLGDVDARDELGDNAQHRTHVVHRVHRHLTQLRLKGRELLQLVGHALEDAHGVRPEGVLGPPVITGGRVGAAWLAGDGGNKQRLQVDAAVLDAPQNAVAVALGVAGQDEVLGTAGGPVHLEERREEVGEGVQQAPRRARPQQLVHQVGQAVGRRAELGLVQHALQKLRLPDYDRALLAVPVEHAAPGVARRLRLRHQVQTLVLLQKVHVCAVQPPRDPVDHRLQQGGDHLLPRPEPLRPQNRRLLHVDLRVVAGAPARVGVAQHLQPPRHLVQLHVQPHPVVHRVRALLRLDVYRAVPLEERLDRHVHQVEVLVARQEGVPAREVRPPQAVVLDQPPQRLAVLRHGELAVGVGDELGLGLRQRVLRQVQVHLVSVEVRVVGVAVHVVEPEDLLVRQHLHEVPHDPGLVQRRLPVHQHHVAVQDVPVHHARQAAVGAVGQQQLRLGLALVERERPQVVELPMLVAVEIRARVGARPVDQQAAQQVHVVRGHVLRDGQLRREHEGDAHLVGLQEAIGRDDGARRVVHTLSQHVLAHGALLVLQALLDSGPLNGLGVHARRTFAAVRVRRDLFLQPLDARQDRAVEIRAAAADELPEVLQLAGVDASEEAGNVVGLAHAPRQVGVVFDLQQHSQHLIGHDDLQQRGRARVQRNLPVGRHQHWPEPVRRHPHAEHQKEPPAAPSRLRKHVPEHHVVVREQLAQVRDHVEGLQLQLADGLSRRAQPVHRGKLDRFLSAINRLLRCARGFAAVALIVEVVAAQVLRDGRAVDVLRPRDVDGAQVRGGPDVKHVPALAVRALAHRPRLRQKPVSQVVPHGHVEVAEAAALTSRRRGDDGLGLFCRSGRRSLEIRFHRIPTRGLSHLAFCTRILFR